MARVTGATGPVVPKTMAKADASILAFGTDQPKKSTRLPSQGPFSMLYDSRVVQRIGFLVCVILLAMSLAGCGGGGSSSGGGGGAATVVRFSVAWPERTRAIGAPASALSVRLILEGASPGGGDFSTLQNRGAGLAAFTEDFTSPEVAQAGSWPLLVRFYAGTAGTGNVVAQGRATISLAANGTGIGTVTADRIIRSVTVTSGQSVTVGGTRDLTFTARDDSGALVAVSPGSARWTVLAGTAFLDLSSDGRAQGKAPGTASVRATVDGASSPAASVTVEEGVPQFVNAGFEAVAIPDGEARDWNSLTGLVWGGSGGAGVARGLSAWGQEAFEGGQYAYIQATRVSPASQGLLQQTLAGFVVGRRYRVEYWIARRNGSSGPTVGAPIRLLQDSTVIAGPTTPPAGPEWVRVQSEPFAATKTSYRFRFICDMPGEGQDTATLLDDVKVVQVD